MNGWDWIEAGQRAAQTGRQTRPCREDGHCDAVYAENDRGGEARGIVGMVAKLAGVQLGTNPLDGNIWSPRNMMRVVEAVQKLADANANLRQAHARRNQADDKTVAALREALTHLGEVV
ncbi:hypothetical protein ACFYWP_01460 [Actinacidiphila glaucinigra]|uniref:hypothetical protein n=1 Tax=Actinacidiphila glaucinigra TaxID=235986 RepID=UPI0036A0D044